MESNLKAGREGIWVVQSCKLSPNRIGQKGLSQGTPYF